MAQQRTAVDRRERKHTSETANEYRNAHRRILILGGGFGGLKTATELDKTLGQEEDVSILLIDRANGQLFTPLLWMVADGRISPNDVVVPLRSVQRGRSFHILHAEIEHIDLDARSVTTSAGAYPYDTLIVALGSVTSVPDLPGLRDNALMFHSPGDAVQFRNHVIDAVEAAHHTDDEDERKAWLTFVVCGGGDTGVELAATIHDYLVDGILAQDPWLSGPTPRIVIVERSERLMHLSKKRVSALTEKLIKKIGVEVLTSTDVKSLDGKVVHTSKESIPARTVFWAAGTAATKIVHDLPVEHEHNGAIKVDEHLRIKGRPEVYVLGDAAWALNGIGGSPVPPTAQAAEQQARYVAKVIADESTGQRIPPYSFESLGHFTLLGQHNAVAEIKSFVFSGLPAYLMWHAYYIMAIGAWRNRIHIGVEWLLAVLTGRETVELRLDMGGPSDEKTSS